MSKKNNIGSSEEIRKLTDYQHARLRTEMYLGSRSPHTQEVLLYDNLMKPFLQTMTWVPALYTAFREILDNACDEVVGHRQGNSIWVEYNPKEMIFSVEDNGRGIPINVDEEENLYMATIALSQARAGRNFRERGEVAGTNGLGAACTNFCSEWFKLEIFRDKKKFVQEFKEGNHLIDDTLTIKKPKITPTSGKTTGTKITFKPSKHVFETIPKLSNNLILPEEFVRSRVIEIAICNPNIKVYYNGQKIAVRNTPEKTLFGDKNIINIPVKDTDFSSKFYILTDFNTEGEFIHSIVNNIPAFNGGAHIDNFRRTFYKGLLTYLEKESRRRKLTPNNSDIQANLLLYNVTTMKAPNFDSQSKTRLINENAGTIVRKALENADIYKSIVRKNKEWIEQIYNRCADRTNKRDDAELNKLSKKLAKNKVPKLMDANGKDRTKCILLITEGESAKAGIRSARNQEIHAALDLKGKPMNVRGTKLTDVLNNAEIIDIMNSIGLMIDKKAERKSLRFGKIYIAHDMDPDGANIGALLVNFFYLYWPELFDPKEEPFIHIFQTPYLIGEKGKEKKYWYASDYHEYDPIKHKEWKITRAKGLATLMKADWEHSLANPNLIPITDDVNMKEILDLIFNESRADDRKIWLE
jgi:DNA gyrase/topoisomerase IV subunit B